MRVQGVGRGARRAGGGGARRAVFRGALARPPLGGGGRSATFLKLPPFLASTPERCTRFRGGLAPRRLLGVWSVGSTVQSKGKREVATTSRAGHGVPRRKRRSRKRGGRGGGGGGEGGGVFRGGLARPPLALGGGGRSHLTNCMNEMVLESHLPHKIVDALFTATNQNDCVGQLTF